MGANVGNVWSHADSVTTDTATGALVTSGSTSRSALTWGGQIGYNYMLSPSWLAGVEVDSPVGRPQGHHHFGRCLQSA